jgi:hypothetical protein
MAQKIVTSFLDDIDGGEAAETVAFGFDGQALEIDLSLGNAGALRQTLQPYIEHARRVTGRASQRKNPRVRQLHYNPVTGQASKSSEERVWLRENGHNPPVNGRISGELHAIWLNRTPAVGLSLAEQNGSAAEAVKGTVARIADSRAASSAGVPTSAFSRTTDLTRKVGQRQPATTKPAAAAEAPKRRQHRAAKPPVVAEVPTVKPTRQPRQPKTVPTPVADEVPKRQTRQPRKQATPKATGGSVAS